MALSENQVFPFSVIQFPVIALASIVADFLVEYFIFEARKYFLLSVGIGFCSIISVLVYRVLGYDI